MKTFFETVDYKLLRKQKKELLLILAGGKVTPKTIEVFDGILNLLDSVQDFAVDEIGLSEQKVFGKKVSNA